MDLSSPPARPKTLEEAFELILALWEENAKLRLKVAELEEKLKTNSQNSSKPPSSDFPSVSKTGLKKLSTRKRGGQKGHEKHYRALVPPEEINTFIRHLPPETCACGGSLEAPLLWSVHQVFDLPQIKPIVNEHQVYAARCTSCHKEIKGTLPREVKGFLAPRALATIGNLSGKYHLSKRNTESLLNEIFGLKVSLGAVSQGEVLISEAIKEPTEEALHYVQSQSLLSADESSLKVGNADGNNPNKTKGWLWLALSKEVSVFKHQLSRSTEAAKSLLGDDFSGVLNCDRHGAYNWVEEKQYCWSHLARDGMLKRSSFQVYARKIRETVKSILEEGASYKALNKDKSARAKTSRTCRALLKNEHYLWTFVRIEGVEPTNNAAERAIRSFVMWRKGSYGSQSTRGSLFIERIMTVTETCKQQGRSVLDFLTESIEAYFKGTKGPSLLPLS